MRLIDADDIKYQLLKPNTNPTLWCVSKDAVDLMPTVDAVHVVRCKDCGFFEVNHFDKVAELDNMPLITAHNICRRWGNGCQTSPDGFCFMGISKKVNE